MKAKTGPVTRRRRKRLLKHAKGYYLSKRSLYKKAKEQLMHSWSYSYNHRKKRKGQMRRLWINRINIALRKHNIKYNIFINTLKKENIIINRKMMSEIAFNYSDDFDNLVRQTFNTNKK